MKPSHTSISAAIPTYLREQVLLQTIEYLIRQDPKPDEILVIDQTPHHEPETEDRLQQWNSDGRIRWIRLDKPSIPAAMNTAFIFANHDIVLFLDDDVIPGKGLIGAHASHYKDSDIWGVAGQVLQPGQEVETIGNIHGQDSPGNDIHFRFNGGRKRFITSCMAGNFSVRRDRAIQIGGFDENFVGDAYRFELEFCRRIVGNGGKILFDPEASLRHLQIRSGGTRAYGSHLTSARADLTSGEYYYILLEHSGFSRAGKILQRLGTSLGRKFYLKRPWWLPVKLYAEIRGLLLALQLKRRGPAYLERTRADTP